MSEIFVAHSRNDKEALAFITTAAARTSVKLTLMEFEGDPGNPRTTEEVENKIDGSSALFMLLGSHVQDIPHTRDWVVWESGRANGKDIWVFESAGAEETNIVVPNFKHYVLYHDTEEWTAYVSDIVNSYRFLDVLEASALGAVVGAVAGPAGAILGGATAGALSKAMRTRPLGYEYTCSSCGHTASVHYPHGRTSFRCVVCNCTLSLASN